MARTSSLFIVSGFLFLQAAPSTAQLPAALPDASQAEIDGRVAVGLWASLGGERLESASFTARLAEEDRLEEELVFPAGHWFQPPPGRYRVWVEGDGQVSPSFAFLQYAGGPFQGRGFAVVMDVVPAGEVEVHPELELPESLSVRLLRAGSDRRGDGKDRGFMRAITAANSDEPVAMPLGEVVGLLYDRAKGRYLAASRPVAVTAHQRAQVFPKAQSSSSDLFVILRRPEPIRRADDDDLLLRLRDGEADWRTPDVMVPTWEWVYALWYGVEGRTARLESVSDRVYLEPTDVVLGNDGMATHRGELRPHPFIQARIELPESIEPESMSLQIFSVEDSRVLHTRDLEPDATETLVEGLPAAELIVLLTIYGHPGWTLRQPADLRDGLGEEVVFRPEPIFLRGTLYHRGEPTVGQIRIATDQTRQRDSWLVVETDDEGNYETILYSAGIYIIYARLPNLPGPDFSVYRSRIRHDEVMDIYIPGTSAVVRVEDSRTGAPVEGALVIYDNHFDHDGLNPDLDGVISSNARTDGEGIAVLPPPRPGKLKVLAERSGYYRSSGVVRRVHDDDELEVVIELDPVVGVTALNLRLASGAPAAGAELRAQYLGWNEPPVWEGRADAEGRVEVPARAETGWLLIRHPSAGAWVQPWLPEGRERLAVHLPPLAPPLTLRSVDPTGEAVPWRSLALRVGGTWVAGRSLAWLAGTHVATTNGSGIWRSSGLAAAGMLVAAGSPATVQLALQGSIDGSAQRLSPPWPEPVEVVAHLP